MSGGIDIGELTSIRYRVVVVCSLHPNTNRFFIANIFWNGRRVGIMNTIRETTSIETDEIWVIRRSRLSQRRFCLQCEMEVNVVGPDEASLIAGTNVGAIFSCIETGQVHIEYFDGSTPMICVASLCSIRE